MNKQQFIWDCEEYAEGTFCDIDYEGVLGAYDFMSKNWPDKLKEKHIDTETLMELDSMYFIFD